MFVEQKEVKVGRDWGEQWESVVLSHKGKQDHDQVGLYSDEISHWEFWVEEWQSDVYFWKEKRYCSALLYQPIIQNLQYIVE